MIINNIGASSSCSIGNLGDYLNEGVQNVTVTSSSFTNTHNGGRIKSWARPSNGYARNIAFRNIIVNNVQNPIIIDRNYCPYNKGCPHQVTNHVNGNYLSIQVIFLTWHQIRTITCYFVFR